MDIQPRSFQYFLSEQLKRLEAELVAQHSRALEKCLSVAVADRHGESPGGSTWLPPSPPQVPIVSLEVPSASVQPPHSVEDPDDWVRPSCPSHNPVELRAEACAPPAQDNLELQMAKMSGELSILRSTLLAAVGDASSRLLPSGQCAAWADEPDVERRVSNSRNSTRGRGLSQLAPAMKSAFGDEPPLLSVPRKSTVRSTSNIEVGLPQIEVATNMRQLPSDTQASSSSVQLQRSRSHFSLREIWAKMKEDKMSKARSAKANTLRYLGSVGSCEDLATVGQGNVPDSNLEFTCIIYPGSPFRTLWTFFCMAILAYDAVMTPMVVFDLQDTVFLEVLGILTSLFWLIDMPLNFMTAYIRDNGSTETSRRAITRRYCQTWFLFDLTVVSVDWTQLILNRSGGASTSSLGLIRALRVMRLARLGRLLKAPAVLESILEKFASGVTGMRSERLVLILPMVKSVLLILLLLHFMACTWFGIGSSNSHGWVDTEEEFLRGMHQPATQYATSLHWALTQFAGSMDVHPRTLPERWFAICALFLGFMTSICFAAIITSSMTQVFIIQEHKASQFMRLRSFLVEAGVSQQLRDRIRQNIRYHFTRKELHTAEEDVELLVFATPLLRAELHRELYQPSLRVHPLFEHLAESVTTARKLCDTAVSKMHVSREDIVFSPGEVQEVPCMLVVMAGMFSYVTGGLDQRSSLEERGDTLTSKPSQLCVAEVPWGMWLCEMHLWIQDWVLHGQLRAQQHSEMLLVDAKNFCTATTHMPEFMDYAANFAAMINNIPFPNDLGHMEESLELVHSTFGATAQMPEHHVSDEFLSENGHRRVVVAGVKEAVRQWFRP